jgi:hypothetical protein
MHSRKREALLNTVKTWERMEAAQRMVAWHHSLAHNDEKVLDVVRMAGAEAVAAHQDALEAAKAYLGKR